MQCLSLKVRNSAAVLHMSRVSMLIDLQIVKFCDVWSSSATQQLPECCLKPWSLWMLNSHPAHPMLIGLTKNLIPYVTSKCFEREGSQLFEDVVTGIWCVLNVNCERLLMSEDFNWIDADFQNSCLLQKSQQQPRRLFRGFLRKSKIGEGRVCSHSLAVCCAALHIAYCCN